MKARIPKHREFIINFPDSIDQNKANEGWAKLQQIVEDYKKAHNGASVYAPTFIEDCEPAVKKLQEQHRPPLYVPAAKRPLRGLFRCAACVIHPRPPKKLSVRKYAGLFVL